MSKINSYKRLEKLRKLNELKQTVNVKYVPKDLMINEHSKYLIDTEMAGNGYHGRCKYCGLAYVTDLGYCSWSGTKCIKRAPQNINDLPNNFKSYIDFNNLRMIIINRQPIFTKPYKNEHITLKELYNKYLNI
ncbi:MAG: hypothetical protein EKK64_03985, partial [Neisseriaceae bacterium]